MAEVGFFSLDFGGWLVELYSIFSSELLPNSSDGVRRRLPGEMHTEWVFYFSPEREFSNLVIAYLSTKND